MFNLRLSIALIACQPFTYNAMAHQQHPYIHQVNSLKSSGFEYKLNKEKGSDSAIRFEHYDLYWHGVRVYNSTLIVKNTIFGDKKLISGNTKLTTQLKSEQLQTMAVASKFAFEDEEVSQHIYQRYPLTIDIIKTERLIVREENLASHFVYRVEVKSRQHNRQFLILDGQTLEKLSSSVSHYAFDGHHDESYHAVSTTTGNYKLGLNCHQAPSMATQKCQNTVLPIEHPVAQKNYPNYPVMSNVYYRGEANTAFNEFSGYPMVVKLENSRCIFKNNWVETYQGSASEPYSYACPNGADESHGIDGDPYFYYYLKGAFKAVNDGHFFGGVAVQTLHWHFKALFPNQQNRCDVESGYCLNKIKQRVDVNNLYQSSWDGEFTNYAGGTIGKPFPHGSSLDIVAHEIGHAILEWNTGNILSDLNFDGELFAELRAKRSALHESFADITAIAVKDYYANHLHAEPSDSNWIHTSIFSDLYHYDNKFWGIGYDSRLTNSFLRHVSMPRLDGISMDDYRDYEQTRGPHQRAGALNKLFYLISSSDGWNVQRAYRLVLKAMTGCFPSNAGMYEASQCLIATADADDKQHISNLAELVGFVSSAKANSQLKVTVKRMYGEVQFDISDPRVSQDNIAHLEVKLDEKPILSWSPQSTELWEEVKSIRRTFGGGAHELSWHVELNDGTELESKRLLSLFDAPLCKPVQNTERFISELSFNGQKSEVEAGGSDIMLTDPVYKQSPISIEMLKLDNNVAIAAYLDTDRNGYFDADSEKLNNLSDSEGKLVYDLSQFRNLETGLSVVRFVLSAQQETSSCAGLDESQVIDVYMALNEGQYTAPSIDFGFKQKNSDLYLSIRQQFSNAYTFKWIFDQKEVVTSDYHIVRSMNQTSEVTLVLLRDGIEVNRLTKTVNVAPEPEFNIDCQQNGTECKLSVEGELPSNIARFAWRVDDQHYTSSYRYLTYDFGTTGVKNVTVSLILQGASVIFEKSQSINLKEIIDFEVSIQQENADFTLNISQTLPIGYSLVWVINDTEYPHSSAGIELASLEPEDRVSYMLKKDGETILEKPINITHVSDPNLQISCQRDGLVCGFVAEHLSNAKELKYVWDFGDGTTQVTNIQQVNYSYKAPGEYTASLTLMVDGRAKFTAQTLVKVAEISVSVAQHNQTLSLSASGEVNDEMTFQWLINNEIKFGSTIDYEFADKAQLTRIKLNVYQDNQEVIEIIEDIQVFDNIDLDFEWSQSDSDNPLKFSFAVKKE
ncbi:PKD domain-containing protein [Pseudoalteromonas luteoviolacea]|uniref:PKD domain-containing protein n=1 Tax=Pseudoalteromonas luteoviolacea S4054 TaxID=1129367 RepID=A0A0F6ABA5_9GAMM|nr:PKD domain-containing protein [Pseudoalteromonas luteoviolacea]AOT08552.1 hypothetical protein S4054249_12140 [Pseudoalteromonas luteoviolacea]AOT13468.1 hypothetical protein S40542_12115 [Pseudoalteromonas luteoviolacea]AOT18381.1 hypothetical protein S4054_12115 [Pseudoalteromonas luteoviolacea]KKE83450.1 hypothetical protein N479_13850 [Pseudoalteromonas luteoviolacea S4054]KZN75887.1 hypothetical protein N481_05945 [Pseudoalteromonas luteoviolacea S4047-1]